ncbi:hypothetical protein BU26DRAFT_567647 [Trematosphaeria pertusa]|uniref:Uncharacterized protein n=1 Tax=Trematosphaeria pertusa TaxID=390896 RepID=A0A6A6I9F1_9PLEO|nr:uncharacterized protein BU26DRAFT_567647 [Trematosphaeria pertusa]KAF2246150.1 hypothetical protein BU26DRAFT_567647 [Trematosphaeria pertusa]
MPRPNRYHPYNRSNQQVMSPRYPPPPSLRLPQPMPAIAEQPLARPYQYIYPGYIRGHTSDGKTLVARQVIQAPDGMLHVQMQVVRFPSEDVKQYASMRQSQSPPASAPVQMPTSMQMQIDPALAGLGIKRDDMPRKCSTSAGSVSSQDARSLTGRSDDCAVSSDEEEDAEGEVVPVVDDGQWRAAVEQRRIVEELLRQREALGMLQ